MTEAVIQEDLYKYWGRTRGGKRAKLMCDCIYLFKWESDFIVLQDNGYILEYEYSFIWISIYIEFFYHLYPNSVSLSNMVGC